VEEDLEKRVEKGICRGELVFSGRRSTRSYKDRGDLGTVATDDEHDRFEYPEEVDEEDGQEAYSEGWLVGVVTTG